MHSAKIEITGPREKLCCEGPSYLSNAELMAVVLGKGTRGRHVTTLSEEIVHLIEKCENEVTFQDLVEIKGIGTTKACQIIASIEFSRRFLNRSRKTAILSPHDAVPLLSRLKCSMQEEFAVITLDSANQVIRTRFVTKGLVNKSQVHPRETFSPAIQDRAVSILLAHNHPSGVLTPSNADLQTTRRMVEISHILGISILDHLIISQNGCCSIREHSPACFT